MPGWCGKGEKKPFEYKGSTEGCHARPETTKRLQEQALSGRQCFAWVAKLPCFKQAQQHTQDGISWTP
jgi:hypothetical protein